MAPEPALDGTASQPTADGPRYPFRFDVEFGFGFFALGAGAP